MSLKNQFVLLSGVEYCNFSATLVNKLRFSVTLIHVVWTLKPIGGKKNMQKKCILRTTLKTIKND